MIWRSPYHSRVAQCCDFLTTMIAFFCSDGIFRLLHQSFPRLISNDYNFFEKQFMLLCIISLLQVYIFKWLNAYSFQRFTSIISEYWIVVKSVSVGLLLTIAILFFLKENPSRAIIIGSYFVIGVFFIIQKSIVFILASLYRKNGYTRKRILLLGTGNRTKHFIDVVHSKFGWGVDIVGLLTDDIEKVGDTYYGIPVLDIFKNIESVLKNINPEEVIVTISPNQYNQIREVFEVCEREGVIVRLNSDFFGNITKNVHVDNVYGLNIISIDTLNHSEFQLILKRILDITGAAAALMFFLPFMIIAAIGIWVSDGSPILYKWNVIGKNKKPFYSWKFRTMLRNADDLKAGLMIKNEMEGPVFKIKDDPRVIPFGRWLRIWSIDETPQLVSVLLGDMSLVGPRPAGVHEIVNYESWHRRKLTVKPGITCLWQVSGRNEIKKFDDWVNLDLEYIDNWSLFLDIKILLKTIPTVLFGRGAS
jgi:exopolysaccharide biosynthesis polyprenyl glycosylphosphotransferase